jgi:hypothetical protein
MGPMASASAARLLREGSRDRSDEAASGRLFHVGNEIGRCLLLAVRPEGADHQWRKIPPESCRLIR